MKIAMLVSTFPPRVGGMGTVVFEEAKKLSKNHQITVFTLDYGDEINHDIKHDFNTVRMKPLLGLGNGGLILSLSRELSQFDLVHLHYPFYGILASLIRSKKLIGFPLVTTYHMDAQGRGIWGVLQKLSDFLYSKRIFKLSDKILAVDNDYFKESKFGKKIKNEKVEILENAVDLEVFKNRQLSFEDLGYPVLRGKKTILFVGNFLQVKNLDFLIELLPELDESVVLVVAGGGYQEEKIKRIIFGTKFEKRILFVGFKTGPKLASLYSAADLVAIPSSSESFSLVALEAMSCGALVVASDIAGLKGRIKNNKTGFLAKPRDKKSWLSCINSILNMDESKKEAIKSEALEFARAYSWEKHCEKLETIYQSL